MTTATPIDHEVIYLAPPCHGPERSWCEDSGVEDCDCLDGPHDWIKYTRQPPSDAMRDFTDEETEDAWASLPDSISLATVRVVAKALVRAALTQGKPDA